MTIDTERNLKDVNMFRFNLNKDISKDSQIEREKFLSRARNACPHAFFVIAGEDNLPSIQIAISSPPGQWHYTCQRCGKNFQEGEMAIELVASRYKFDLAQKTYDPEGALLMLKDEKKFTRILKKAGYV